MSGRPKDQAISEDEYRRKEADAMQRTADQNRALRSMVGRLRALASDWEANSGSRGLGERSEATAWSKAASQLREAISPSEPQAEPSSEVPEPSAEGWSTDDRRNAEAEAKHRWHVEESRTRTSQRDFDNFNQGCINGFMLGAEWWKATHPAAPEPEGEPTDAQANAILAVVAELRTANLIAARAQSEFPRIDLREDNSWETVQLETDERIRERLGLS